MCDVRFFFLVDNENEVLVSKPVETAPLPPPPHTHTHRHAGRQVQLAGVWYGRSFDILNIPG